MADQAPEPITIDLEDIDEQVRRIRASVGSEQGVDKEQLLAQVRDGVLRTKQHADAALRLLGRQELLDSDEPPAEHQAA